MGVWHAESMSIRTEPVTEELLGLFPPGSRLDGDGTLTVVHSGAVIVTDFRRHKNVVVHAGQRYLATAR